MSIVVTTPTGNVGSHVVRLLLQAGVRPRLLARDPSRLDAGTRQRADVRRGDLTDAAFVRDAISGARTVFWVDPTPHTAENPIETSVQTASALVDAARSGDVARVVLLSSIGAEKRGGAGHIDALARIEEQLDATGADTLHLRCGCFFTNLLMDLDGLAGGVLTTAARPDAPLPWVDPRDIGDIVAVRLLNEEWKGHAVQAVHGPEDLSYTQIAETLTEVLGRPIRLVTVTDDEVRVALTSTGLPPSAVEGIVGMTAGTRDLTAEQPRDLVTTTPTSLASWAYTHLRPLLPTPGT